MIHFELDILMLIFLKYHLKLLELESKHHNYGTFHEQRAITPEGILRYEPRHVISNNVVF